MPKPRHGCSFDARWMRVVCVLTSLNCDHRIIHSVSEGLTNETCELFASKKHKSLCMKTFGARRVQSFGEETLMWKNGMIFNLDVSSTHIHCEMFFNLHYNRIQLNEETETMHWNAGGIGGMISKEISPRSSMQILNRLAWLSRCDFTFWKQILLKYDSINPNKLFLKTRTKLHKLRRFMVFDLDWCTISITFLSNTNNYYQTVYYYDPLRPNLSSLTNLLDKIKDDIPWEPYLEQQFDDDLFRVCDETRKSEIAGLLNLHTLFR